MRFALRSWFCAEHSLLAWLGALEFVVHAIVDTAVWSAYTAWLGDTADLLGTAVITGPSALPQVYAQMQRYIPFILFWGLVRPAHEVFKKWYMLKSDQTVQRAYVAQWPTGKVPEGTLYAPQTLLLHLRSHDGPTA